MKNLFGITPNSLYGSEGTGEDKLGYRGPIHGKAEGWVRLSRREGGLRDQAVGVRVPRTIVDENLARPRTSRSWTGSRRSRRGGVVERGIAPIDPGVIVAASTRSRRRGRGGGHGFDARRPLHGALRDAENTS